MDGFPLQGAVGVLVGIVGIGFALMEWSRSRGRLGRPATIFLGSLIVGALIAKPDLIDTGRERASDLLDWLIHLGQ